MLCVSLTWNCNFHGKTNEQLNLRRVTHSQTEYQRMTTAFNQADETLFANEHEPLLTPEQRKVYDTIASAVCDKNGRPFMIDAPAGTGKTFGESNCCTSKGVG